MKHNILILFIQLLHTTRLGSSTISKQLLSSPVGPYQLVIRQVYNCNPTKNNTIQHYTYISHRANTTWLLGNSTLEAPLDDTLFLEIKLAVKDSLGNWKENVLSHKIPNACTSIKRLLGSVWTVYMNGSGSKNTKCPILPGIYTYPGIDTSIFKDSNLPKTFFYGTFKFYVYYTRKNEIYGCQVFIIETKKHP
ncbi:uncharacterized protein LOC111027548 [Myzus persicae]|uniref:uncharacterized protein LOC111027548 n=1 Tax=Myzus persicae TaxID=13164 RepID=UPI000B930E3E|nr:uncharacterized protein LOC111027548 [Myzus persicae]